MAGAPKGNNNAGKGKMWRDALHRALARAADGRSKTVEAGLDKVANTVVQQAMEGDKDAWREIADRTDGKPTQVHAGDEENPLVPSEIIVTLVRPGEARPTEKPARKKTKKRVTKKKTKKKVAKKRVRKR